MKHLASKFFNLTHELLSLFDNNGCFVVTNRAWELALGWTPSDLAGRSLTALLHPDTLDPSRFMDRVLQNAPVEQRTARVHAKDGSWRWLEWNAYRSPDSHIVYGFSRDVTEKRSADTRLSLALRQQRTLMSILPAGVIELEADGTCSFVNERWCDIAGLTPEQARGHGWRQLFKPKDIERLARDFQVAMSRGRLFQGEFRLGRPDGASVLVHLAATSVPSEDAGALGFIGVVQDITHIDDTQRKLRAAQEEAVRISRMKSEFLANISHEIRTPLNGVIGMAQLLMDTPLNDEQRDMASTIHLSSSTLITLVNDILDFSKIEAGRVSLELAPFSLSTLMDEITRMFLGATQTKGLRFSLTLAEGVPDALIGDTGRVSQILINLIGNAIKFTDVGGIDLRVSRVPGSDPRVASLLFEVRDSGVGIPPEVQHRIFDEFIQADSSVSRRYGGTGLGLSIARRLVALMGGTIGVQSSPNDGSRFWFQLPLTLQNTESRVDSSPSSPAPIPTAPFPAVVLLAEDSRVNQLVAIKMLQKLGYEAHAVNNGQEAVDAVRARRFDLILMDCHMPGMDGFAASVVIRGEGPEWARDVPIIALTADVTPGIRSRCAQAGMSDYLSKPLRMETLAEMIACKLARDDATSTEP